MNTHDRLVQPCGEVVAGIGLRQVDDPLARDRQELHCGEVGQQHGDSGYDATAQPAVPEDRSRGERAQRDALQLPWDARRRKIKTDEWKPLVEESEGEKTDAAPRESRHRRAEVRAP